MSSLERRCGIGYDSHRFGGEGPLVLGGIEIPGGRALEGHSDADVVAHAVTDAVLGAAGLGDIGEHFPDHEPRLAGADSIALLAEALVAVGAPGWRVVNVDVSVLAEQPRLSAFKTPMAQRLAEALGVDASAVNVKAKSNEGMGFVGRGEGIAALAVAQIERSA
jgi:2-C-methyl-D-erythritol 2,4-cyclodiphosphate synthase